MYCCLLSVESGSSTTLSSKSDNAEYLLSVAGNSNDKMSMSSIECQHSDDRSLTDLNDVKQVHTGCDDNEPECLVQRQLSSACYTEECLVPTDRDSSDFHSEQLSDSEELVSSSNGVVHSSADADSHQLSDAAEQSAVIDQLNMDTTADAQISVSCSSHPHQSKLDHSRISSTLKNISQNEDEGLIYIVSSKPSSDCNYSC